MDDIDYIECSTCCNDMTVITKEQKYLIIVKHNCYCPYCDEKVEVYCFGRV